MQDLKKNIFKTLKYQIDENIKSSNANWFNHILKEKNTNF